MVLGLSQSCHHYQLIGVDIRERRRDFSGPLIIFGCMEQKEKMTNEKDEEASALARFSSNQAIASGSLLPAENHLLRRSPLKNPRSHSLFFFISPNQTKNPPSTIVFLYQV